MFSHHPFSYRLGRLAAAVSILFLVSAGPLFAAEPPASFYPSQSRLQTHERQKSNHIIYFLPNVTSAAPSGFILGTTLDQTFRRIFGPQYEPLTIKERLQALATKPERWQGFVKLSEGTFCEVLCESALKKEGWQLFKNRVIPGVDMYRLVPNRNGQTVIELASIKNTPSMTVRGVAREAQHMQTVLANQNMRRIILRELTHELGGSAGSMERAILKPKAVIMPSNLVAHLRREAGGTSALQKIMRQIELKPAPLQSGNIAAIHRQALETFMKGKTVTTVGQSAAPRQSLLEKLGAAASRTGGAFGKIAAPIGQGLAKVGNAVRPFLPLVAGVGGVLGVVFGGWQALTSGAEAAAIARRKGIGALATTKEGRSAGLRTVAGTLFAASGALALAGLASSATGVGAIAGVPLGVIAGVAGLAGLALEGAALLNDHWDSPIVKQLLGAAKLGVAVAVPPLGLLMYRKEIADVARRVVVPAVKKGVQKVGQAVKQVVQKVVTGAEEIAKQVGESFKRASTAVVQTAKKVSTDIAKAVTGRATQVVSRVSTAASSLSKAVTSTVSNAVPTVSKAVSGTVSAVGKAVISTVSKGASSVGKSVTATVSKAASTVSKAATSIAKAVTTTVSKAASTVTKAATSVAKAVTSTVSKAASSVSNAVSSVGKAVSSFFSRPAVAAGRRR